MNLPFLSEKKQSGEVYCGILLKEAQGICFVYQKEARTVRLLKQKEFQYSDGWEHIVDDIDEALSIIEQEMGKQTNISQCIFFIFAHLLDPHTHEIAKPYIAKMRDISKLLELKPIGYMEVIDAVHEELEQEKQARLSSIVVELDDTQMTVFLFKGGHKIAIQSSSRTDNFPSDMQAALEAIAQSHILPNHIYLYDSTDLAEESSDLLLHSWKRNLFIQQPRIAVVPSSTVSNALQKLLEKQLCVTPQSSEVVADAAPKEVLGFTIGEEVFEHKEKTEDKPLPKKTQSFSFPKITFPSAKILSLIAVPVFALAIFLGIIFLIHKATITLRIPTEKKDAEITIIASKKPTIPDQVELQSVTGTFNLTQKKATTGKRDVGEKAVGEVTIYSYGEKEMQLSKGTKLQTGSLVFDTTSDITIPSSQFASDGITKNPGKGTVKVQADVLGTDSNIDKNKRFSVADMSANTVFGINAAPIGGGTKQVIQTISKDDLDTLRQSVYDKAKQDALNKQKSDTSSLLLPELATVAASKEQFSGEVGEAANNLSYTGTGEVVLYKIPKSAIEDFIKKQLENEKPDGFQAGAVTFTVKKQSQLKTGDTQLSLKGEISFVKSVVKNDIMKAIVGKRVTDGQAILRSQFGISEATIVVDPRVPLIKEWLPFSQNNIRIDLLR